VVPKYCGTGLRKKRKQCFAKEKKKHASESTSSNLRKH
jgi:hypothetical protein